MNHCANLRIEHPEFGSTTGKCPLINNRESILEFMEIKDIIEGIDATRAFVPNEECPFFMRGMDQTSCPHYG